MTSWIGWWWWWWTQPFLKKMYQELMTALDEARKNDACMVTVMTGSGEYYCSGNDLGNFTRIPPTNDAWKVLKYGSSSMSLLYHRFPDHLSICGLPVFSRSTRVSTPQKGLPFYLDKAVKHLLWSELDIKLFQQFFFLAGFQISGEHWVTGTWRPNS